MIDNERFFRQVDRAAWLAAVGVSVATILGFLGVLFWFFDLFAHFRVQYFQVCLVLVGIAIWRRKNRLLFVAVAIGCLNYALVLPFYFGKPSGALSDETFRAMLMNLNASNGNTDQVLDAIQKASPELLVMEEVTPTWEHELTALHLDYPYRVAAPRGDCFGIMLLSRRPLSSTNIVYVGTAGVPSVVATVHLPKGEISVVGTHPVPPVSPAYCRHRNSQLLELPDVTLSRKHPVLLIGDLNVSPWSYFFRRLMTDSGLKNSMKGFGFQPSWPVGSPWLRIPIDHILHSPQVTILKRTVGPDIGSDHYPVVVDFKLAGQ